jgi:hypothetical protein
VRITMHRLELTGGQAEWTEPDSVQIPLAFRHLQRSSRK